MSAISSNGDRLRRATQLWHAYLTATGLRFELAQFLKDAALEKQVLDGSLVSGDPKLVALATEWLRDTGQPVPAAAGRPAPPTQPAAAGSTPVEAPKPNRYLRGVR
jgi:hypothetical protein